MGSSCMYNALKVRSFWPRVVACLPASEKWTFSQQCCSLQKCNTLGKVFFFFELKYTGKVIWDLREKAPFPVRAKANASLPNWTPRQATSISSKELPRAVTFYESCHHQWKLNCSLRFMPMFLLLTQLQHWQIKRGLKNQTRSCFSSHSQNITLYMLWKNSRALNSVHYRSVVRCDLHVDQV